jgi:5-methyltetrahydropteroyltriglutamate--homocysteine methyltransferase
MITTVSGSYPKVPNRPRAARLRNALNKLDRGEITPEEVEALKDQVTVEVIEEQTAAGLDLITDGGIRWDDEVTYFARALGGVTLNGLFRYFDTNTYYRQPVINAAVSWEKPVAVRDYEFAAANSSLPVKAILPAPYSLARLSIDEHYGDRFESLVMDLATAINSEAHALAAAGVPVIQLNDPVLTKRKEDVGLAVRATTAALEGVSSSKQVNYYYGDVDGILGAIAESPLDIIGLDFVMGPENYGAVESVRPRQKICAGIVDARNTRMESETDLSERIGRLAGTLSPEQLQISPNMGLEFLPRERALEKLQRMVTVARRGEEVAA